MEKKKASKRATPSLRTKKKSNEKQKSSSRQASHGSRTVSSNRNKKEAAAKTSKSTNDGVLPKSVIGVDPDTMTDKDNKKKEEKRKNSVVKKKPSEVEKKLDVTQDDCTKEDPKATAEVASNNEIVPDKNPAKMDDGYEDFGPGAA